MSDDSQTLQVHIEAPTREFTQLAAIEAEVDERETTTDASTRTIGLTTGGETLVTEGDPFQFTGNPEGTVSCTVIPDRAIALGYYLHALEQHCNSPAEEELMYATLDTQDLDLVPYWEMQKSLTPRKRRKRLFNWWEWRSSEAHDFAADTYFDEATWRSTNLTESGMRLAEDIENTTPVKPRMCYLTAGEAAINHIDNHRVEYVEGMVLPTEAGQAVRHAWIEIDGEVAELTWPWHRYDGGDAVYIGQSFPKEEVKEHRESPGNNGAIALDDEQLEKVSAAMQGNTVMNGAKR